MNKHEQRISGAVKRLESASCTSRLRKSIKETFGFLDAKEQVDVLAFVVYEAWLVHRSRSIVRSEPCKTFDKFLTEFLSSSFLDSVENE